jgi:putative restriction endonuclease
MDTSQYRGSSNVPSPGLYLIPVSDEWRAEFRHSVEEPHDLQQYAEIPPELAGIDRLRIWATTETDADTKQAAIDEMEPDDCVLFYHDGEFFSGGTIGRTFDNPDVGDLLWNNPESRHLFTVEAFIYDVPRIERVWEMLGYDGRQVVQGFTRVADERIEEIPGEDGSLESVLFGDDEREPAEEAIEREKSELAQAIESEPELTEDQTQYVATRRRARDRAFTELVWEAYDTTCAVCGSQRESPDGNPEVDAAHIYPVSENGRNDIRNGIALCKFHHWAFDSGWVSFTDDHEIIVTEAPDRNGYQELKQLEGYCLSLPQNVYVHPHPIFLEQHRKLHGFEE